MSVQFSIIGNAAQRWLTVFIPGHDPKVADDSHPNFPEIREELACDYPDPEYLLDLFDVEKNVATRFQKLTERVSVANGRVYLDGDEVDDSLTRLIVRYMSEGRGRDFWPLVRFFENVANNPNDHSKQQFFAWARARDLTITEDGEVIGYKGVHRQPDGRLLSGFGGKAIVNGEVVRGRIPNEVGSLIEMPRSEVRHDPSSACSTGLHVGTFEYASGYAQGAMLKVAVNPRDVVSVPTDAQGEKVRVCRYRVLDVIDRPLTVAYDEDTYDDDSKCDEIDDDSKCDEYPEQRGCCGY